LSARNTIVASGEIQEVGSLRFTPAGLTVLNFTIRHHSLQKEAGIERKVQAEFRCILIGEKPHKLERIQNDKGIKVKGFMTAQSAKALHRLVLHVTAYELIN
jgi:primosomal replication protein N